MSRKSFSNSPNPKSNNKCLEDFEKNGAGHDTDDTKLSKEPIMRLTADLPKSLHKRFKAACTLADTSMRSEIIIAISERVAVMESSRKP